MKLKLSMILILAIGVGLAFSTNPEDNYYEHSEPSYWQEFKNALSDMNPFGGRLGHDWRDTQYRVEDIYRESHLDAQRKVAELREENLKDSNLLQKKIADIYLTAAADAEKRIEKLKHPLIASLWYGRRGSGGPSSYEEWYPTATHEKARHYYDKGKEMAGDAAEKLKKKLSPGDEVGMFDEASRKIRDTYHEAMNKAKEGISSAPSMKETWDETKRRLSNTYDNVFKTSHGEARNILERLRDGFDRGAHKVGDVASSAMYKTWHLLLHGLLAGFWLLMGGLAYSGIQMYWDKRTFNKQLAAPLQGPVVLSKIFHVYGTEDTQKKFQDYWTNTAQGFFARQPGLRKFSLIRGVNIGSNCWCHMSEWNSIEDLRRAVGQPEIAELKKRMPKSFYSKRCISQIVTTGKGGSGGAESVRGEGDVRSEGLRQRGGPGTQTTS